MDEELYFSLLKTEINIVKSMGIKAVKSSKNEIQELHNVLFTHEYETLDEIRDSLSVCEIFSESMSMVDRVKFCLKYIDCYLLDFEGSKERMGWYLDEEAEDIVEVTRVISGTYAPYLESLLGDMKKDYYESLQNHHVIEYHMMIPFPERREGNVPPDRRNLIMREIFELNGDRKIENEENTDNEIISLNEIDSLCMEKYHEYPNRIIMIVLARFDLDEVKTIIRKHYKYWHEVTGERIDFFWLGYGVRQTPSVYYGAR